MIKSGTNLGRVIARARVVLLLDRSQGKRKRIRDVIKAAMVSQATVTNVKRRHFAGGLGRALHELPRAGAKPKVDGEVEAHLITLACSDPPEGYARWTLRLLADRLVQLEAVDLDYISHLTVREVLKNKLKPWRAKSWCIRKPSPRFVAKMEDVLSACQRPYDPKRPQACLDETSKTLHSTPRGEIPLQPGRPQREDYEYQRHGTCALFLAMEPLAGFRHVWVRPRRTNLDCAEVLRDLVEVAYPDADQIVLVVDNLNIHHPACLYERFAPAEARRIAAKIEWHYTPEHGSWLNVAEGELSGPKRQCLKRRVAALEVVEREADAWQEQRNQAQTGADWQFTTDAARIKLKRLYPIVEGQKSD